MIFVHINVPIRQGERFVMNRELSVPHSSFVRKILFWYTCLQYTDIESITL